jgi:hypothetical protein
MIWNNYIGTEFLVPEWICENIIDIGEDRIKQGLADKEQYEGMDMTSIALYRVDSYKNSENFTAINEAIKYSLNEFLNKFTIDQTIHNYEYPHHKWQKSTANGGFWNWHFENNGKHRERSFVWMLYLNTVEKGGYTEFYKTKDEIIRVKPEIGKFVFWPAGETHMHRSSPDLQENKYILTGWVCRNDGF